MDVIRTALILSTSALLAGCQSYNPLAVFGPATVPAPGSSQSQPYYPSTVAKSNSAAPSVLTRPSVSAENGSPAPVRGPMVTANAGDREPIRIVENPSPTRTAAAPSRSQSPAPGKATTPAQAPVGTPALPANPLPSSKPGASPQSRFRADPAVAPASYQPSAGAFSERPAEAGQWRAR